jgi:hypothetical protein
MWAHLTIVVGTVPQIYKKWKVCFIYAIFPCNFTTKLIMDTASNTQQPGRPESQQHEADKTAHKAKFEALVDVELNTSTTQTAEHKKS